MIRFGLDLLVGSAAGLVVWLLLRARMRSRAYRLDRASMLIEFGRRDPQPPVCSEPRITGRAWGLVRAQGPHRPD